MWFIATLATGVAIVCAFLGVWVEGLVAAAISVAALRAAYMED